MDNVVLAIVAGAWMLEALVLGYVMGRRGYEAYSWTLLGTVFGPIAVVVAIRSRSRRADNRNHVQRVAVSGRGSGIVAAHTGIRMTTTGGR